MDEYQFVKSQLGKDKLTFRGHVYRHQRSRNNNHYFRCEDKNCYGSTILRGVAIFNTIGGSVSEGKAHNHAPLTTRVEIVQAVDAIKIRAKTTNSAPAAIAQAVRQELGINAAVELPSKSAMRQVIHRIRKKELHTDQEMARLIAGHNPTKKKKEQIQREERLATVFPLDEYLRGIAHNLHFSSRNVNDYELEANFGDADHEF